MVTVGRTTENSVSDFSENAHDLFSRFFEFTGINGPVSYTFLINNEKAASPWMADGIIFFTTKWCFRLRTHQNGGHAYTIPFCPTSHLTMRRSANRPWQKNRQTGTDKARRFDLCRQGGIRGVAWRTRRDNCVAFRELCAAQLPAWEPELSDYCTFAVLQAIWRSDYPLSYIE